MAVGKSHIGPHALDGRGNHRRWSPLPLRFSHMRVSAWLVSGVSIGSRGRRSNTRYHDSVIGAGKYLTAANLNRM